MSQLYSFASLGGTECGLFRLRGVGLANCLFPWARCLLASERHGLRRIASTWPQLCHRQWMRRDLDKRCYLGLIDESNAIQGLRRLALLAGGRRIPEEVFLRQPDAFDRGVVIFAGMVRHFEAMLNDHQTVRDRLIAATRPRHRAAGRAMIADSISIHVRFGDAIDPDSPRARTVSFPGHIRQRITWYIHALNECRRNLGYGIPASVFSDGSEDELRPLLAQPNVRRVFFGSALADLLAMSAAPLLIASSSTFSMWAAYLGRMPVIWPKAQRRQRLHGEAWQFESELGYERLPEEVAALIKRANLLGATA